MHKQETVQTISENLCCYSGHDERHSCGTHKNGSYLEDRIFYVQKDSPGRKRELVRLTLAYSSVNGK